MTIHQTVRVSVAPHPLLRPVAFTTTFPEALGTLPTPKEIMELLSPDATAPVARDEAHRMAVRDMLRHWGHKPAGRGKPASEYLVRAVDRGELDSINLAVDICNAVSYHSGHSIALVDLDLGSPPFHVAPGPEDGSYVFNRSGQEMSLKGLICLFDGEGPCGNPVKDAQRTKTNEATTRTLTVIWGVAGYPERLAQAFDWYRELLEGAGAVVTTVPVELEGPEG